MASSTSTNQNKNDNDNDNDNDAMVDLDTDNSKQVMKYPMIQSDMKAALSSEQQKYLANLNNQVVFHDQVVSGLVTRLQQHDEVFGSMVTRMKQLNNTIQCAGEALINVDAKVTNVDTRVQDLQEQVATLQNQMSQTQVGQQQIQQALSPEQQAMQQSVFLRQVMAFFLHVGHDTRRRQVSAPFFFFSFLPNTPHVLNNSICVFSKAAFSTLRVYKGAFSEYAENKFQVKVTEFCNSLSSQSITLTTKQRRDLEAKFPFQPYKQIKHSVIVLKTTVFIKFLNIVRDMESKNQFFLDPDHRILHNDWSLLAPLEGGQVEQDPDDSIYLNCKNAVDKIRSLQNILPQHMVANFFAQQRKNSPRRPLSNELVELLGQRHFWNLEESSEYLSSQAFYVGVESIRQQVFNLNTPPYNPDTPFHVGSEWEMDTKHAPRSVFAILAERYNQNEEKDVWSDLTTKQTILKWFQKKAPKAKAKPTKRGRKRGRRPKKRQVYTAPSDFSDDQQEEETKQRQRRVVTRSSAAAVANPSKKQKKKKRKRAKSQTMSAKRRKKNPNDMEVEVEVERQQENPVTPDPNAPDIDDPPTPNSPNFKDDDDSSSGSDMETSTSRHTTGRGLGKGPMQEYKKAHNMVDDEFPATQVDDQDLLDQEEEKEPVDEEQQVVKTKSGRKKKSKKMKITV